MKLFSIFFFLISLLMTTTVFADVFSSDYKALEGHRTTVHSIAFTKDGRYLAASGGNNEVIVWDVKTGRQTTRGAKNPQNKPLNFMAINDRGTLIATFGFMDPAVKISRFSNGTPVRTIKAHSGEKSGLAFFPGTDLLVTAGIDEGNKVSLKLWNASTGRLVKVLYRAALPVSHEYISGLSFSHDGRRLACGISNKKHGIMIFDMKKMKLLKYVRYTADVSDVSFSPDGRFIAGGSINKKVIIWNSVTGRVIREMAGHRGFVSSVSFSSDGRYIASAGMGYRNNFRLWDAASGRLVQAMAGHNQGINAVVFSPDGTSLAVGVTTHGDLFKIDTVRLFSTAAAARKAPWYKVSSGVANLKARFPGEPEARESYKSDRNFAYSRFKLDKGNSTYYIRVVEYKYRMNPGKARSQVEKITNQLVSQGTRRGGRLVSKRRFRYRGNGGSDSLIIREKRGTTYRKRYRVIFIGKFLYEIRFTGTGKKESPGEKRFFESFGTMR